MSFFHDLIANNYNSIHDRRDLWEYNLTNHDFEKLSESLNSDASGKLDPRDIALYFAEWWKWKYDGGTPTKEAVFNSLPLNFRIRIDIDNFYDQAKKGGERLGIQWNKRQNYLYFRTLLLQGGLPLNHIKKNKGKYQAFLLAVLELQPDSVEDIIDNPQLTRILPSGSRNDVVYQNSFEIVRNILDDEDDSYRSLLDFDEELQEISNELRVRKSKVKNRERVRRPKISWFLNHQGDEPFIYLRFGFAKKYKNEEFFKTFNNLPNQARSFQLYINDNLVCSFRRNRKGDYLTSWIESEGYRWNIDEKTFPELYFLHENEEGKDQKINLNDLLQLYPDTDKPTLWIEVSDTEWKMAKGNAVRDEKAKVIFPNSWKANADSKTFTLYDKDLLIVDFEGEVILETEGEEISFRTNVQTFDWSILSRDPQPEWISKANMVVVRKTPKILFYNENNELLKQSLPKIEVKSRSEKEWKNWDDIKALPIGCLDIRFKKDGVVAYDKFYNIGALDLIYSKQTLETAEIEVRHNPSFQFTLIEKEVFNADTQETVSRTNPFSQPLKSVSYTLNLNPTYLKIPRSIEARLKLGSQESLLLHLKNPFTGTRIIAPNGEILSDGSVLNLNNLSGYRILKSPKEEVSIHLENSIRNRVKINKQIELETSPLRMFREDFLRLFLLTDAMDYRNSVKMTLEAKGEKVSYFLKSYTDVLDVSQQLEGKVRLEDNNNSDLDLLAIPLNCPASSIEAIPLERDDDDYSLPVEYQQFVIISADRNEKKFLSPRFVNSSPYYKPENPVDRIERYHQELLNSDYESDIWEEVNQYLRLCMQYDLAFSTFDQLRAIGRSSEVAAKAFFYLCLVTTMNIESFIQHEIPKIERDLGFCFHWIKKEDWQNAIFIISSIDNSLFKMLTEYLGLYLEESDMIEIMHYFSDLQVTSVTILNPDITNVRMQLGERVLKEMPIRIPHTTQTYNLTIERNNPVKLILYSGIAIAEGIKGVNQKSLWDNSDLAEELRKNVQYVQFLVPDFYKKLILHVLSR